MQPHDPALATTVTHAAASVSASGLLSDAEVERLGALNAEIYPQIAQAKSDEQKQAAREQARQQIEERLKGEGHPWADVWAHAVVHDHLLHDAKYRVMLDWFNNWVKRIDETKVFAKFTKAELLGKGGFGAVFKAFDTKRPGWVAVKIPHVPPKQMPTDRNTVTSSAQHVLKFFEEARKHAEIRVQGCVPLFDNGMPVVFENDQVQVDHVLDHLRKNPLWFSMQLVDGRSLEEVLRPKTENYTPGQTMTDKQVGDLMTRIAEILKVLHATPAPPPDGKGNIIHKDLKPANILLDQQGNVWLTDFGLATPRADQTVFGNPLSGTPQYMAPEQWNQGTDANYANAQTDIWAWGTIFYELLIGRPPFSANTLDELRDQILNSDADSTRAQRSDIAEYIDHIILKCLKRDRTERYGSFAEVLDALKSPMVTSDAAEQIRGGLDRVETKVDVVRVEQTAGLARVMQIGTEVDAKVEVIGSTVERMAAMTVESHSELMKESCELSNRGEHEGAYEIARKAVSIARRLKDENLERRYLIRLTAIVVASGAAGDEGSAIDRLRRIQHEFKVRLGTDTWHHLVINLWLSRLLREHDGTITISRQILSRDDADVHAKVDALSGLLIALSRLGRTTELLTAAAELEELSGRLDVDDQVVLRANWLLSAADSGLFERGSVTQYLECVENATLNNELPISRAGEILLATAEAFRRAGWRTERREWLEAARDVLQFGHDLVEPTRDSRRLLAFSAQLAEVEVDLKNDDEAETWLQRAANALNSRTDFESPAARLSFRCGFEFTKARILLQISERSDRTRQLALLHSSLTGFEEAERLFDKSSGAVDGEVDLLAAEIAQRKATILDRLGNYRTALVEVRRASDALERRKREPDRSAFLRLHEAELLVRLGDIGTARIITDELLKLSDLSPERMEHIREFDRYLANHVFPTFDWLSSDEAVQVGQQAQHESLCVAIAEIHRPLVEAWNAWREEESSWPASELFDFWGKGAFMRIVSAVRARPTQAIAVDARTIDEIRHWARVFCPLFDTVIIKWKGKIHSNCLLIVPRHMDQGPPGTFGGHGYVSTADSCHDNGDMEWNVAMGWANPMPADVCAFLATEALRLIERGRLTVIPAPLVGASQLDVGWSDDLLTGGLFRGVVNAARIAQPNATGKPVGVRTVDVTTAAVPYMQGISLLVLAEVLDDLSEGVTALRKLWSSEISYVATDQWQRIDGLTSDFQDACRLLRERMTAVSKKPSIDRPLGELQAGTSAIAPLATSPDGPPITEMLRALSGETQIKPWIPFWRLSDFGGILNWDASMYRFSKDDIAPQAHPISRMREVDELASVEHSWLCPGDGGCGIATAWRA
jgi:serine/threonine protein kinase/tetratricopeptide (TPR) repeat protein